MTVYQNNLAILKETNQDIYQLLIKEYDQNCVGIEETMDHDQCLIVHNDNNYVALSSIYSPKHEAERFVCQFQADIEPLHIVIFGFGSGYVIRQILQNDKLYEQCIVYEPSPEIFRGVMEVYDIREILKNPRFHLFIQGYNDSDFFACIDEWMDYINWEFYRYSCLPKYRELFPTVEKKVHLIFHTVCNRRKIDQNTLIHYSKIESDNEIRTFQWLIDGRSVYDLRKSISENDVCIIVAAGPSLEKNIYELKRAKGKAFIFCVDSAVKYMLNNGIIPDMICTVDPQKGGTVFDDPRLNSIPMAITPESDHVLLEMLHNPIAMYFSAGNDFCKQLFEEKDYEMPYFYGGGSVATTSFKLAVELGFHTIVLVGQDLAIEKEKIHAGREEHEETVWEKLQVDGYYGEKVVTLTDFKQYLDWYETEIAQLKNSRVINATEGGARIPGTEQMPLSKVIDLYCLQEKDYRQYVDDIPEIWSTRDEKLKLYGEMKSQRDCLLQLNQDIILSCKKYQSAESIYNQGKLSNQDAERLNLEIKQITQKIDTGQASMMVYKRMMETKLSFRRKQYVIAKADDDRSGEIIQLMIWYLQETSVAICEMLEEWENVLEIINNKYQFEKKSERE